MLIFLIPANSFIFWISLILGIPHFSVYSGISWYGFPFKLIEIFMEHICAPLYLIAQYKKYDKDIILHKFAYKISTFILFIHIAFSGIVMSVYGYYPYHSIIGPFLTFLILCASPTIIYLIEKSSQIK